MSATVQVTFDGNGGSAPAEPKTVTVGERYGYLPTPSRTGYAFAGWFTQASGGDAVASDTTVAKTIDHPLYAHWSASQTATITFNANGGTDAPEAVEFATGDPVAIPDEKPIRTGAIFAGWSTDPAALHVDYFPGKVYYPAASMALYAAWRLPLAVRGYSGDVVEQFRTLFSAAYATVQGLPDGVFLIPALYPYIYAVQCRTSGASQTYDDPFTHLYIALDTTGQFASLFSTISGAIGEATPSMTETARLFLSSVLYAGTQVGPTYLDIMLAVDLDALDADGYEFEGWFHTEAGGTIQDGYCTGTDARLRYGDCLNTEVTQFLPASGHHMIAPLVRKKRYICVFDPQGGTVSPAFIYVTDGDPYGELPTPTLSRYGFAGWFTDPEGGAQVTAETVFTSRQDHVLYAHWTVDGMARVLTFDWADGYDYEVDGWDWPAYKPSTVTTQTVFVGEPYGTLPNPVRTGYQFAGWFRSTVGSDQISASTIAEDEDLTVYAHWIALTTTLTFDANGGTVSETTRTVPYGTQYGTLPVPVRNGYSFDGWFTAQTGGDAVSAATVAEGSRILWAHWSNGTVAWGYVKYSIHLVNNGGELDPAYGELKYVAGYEKALPTREQISKTGYWFGGWYDNPDFTGSSVISIPASATGSKTYYARWL